MKIGDKRLSCSEEQLHELSDESAGFCTGCGEIQDGGVEPDAENYPCDSCELKLVFGIEQLAIMGLVDIEEDGE